MTGEDFTQAVQAYGDTVFRVAYHALGSREDGEDVMQTVFLRLFERSKGFESQDHLKHWLLRVAVNESRKVLRAFWRRTSVPLDDWPELAAPDGGERADLFRAVMALEAPGLGYYTDVPADTWYARAAEYAAENALMNGVGNGRFAPGQTTSRAMLAAILWRVEGEPAVQAGAELVDVPDGQWYTDAIRWAQAEGILTGYGDGRFGPNDPVTRQDMVTLLWRYAEEPEASAQDFADEASIAGYAAQAVDWARANEIVGGVGDNQFAPTGSATRAQTAVILRNFLPLNG